MAKTKVLKLDGAPIDDKFVQNLIIELADRQIEDEHKLVIQELYFRQCNLSERSVIMLSKILEEYLTDLTVIDL